jgi:glycosyltransferase involved in cell wall biosynthesis
MTPRLSLVIATRNRRERLGETLAAIEQQRCDGVEVVVADGASEDGCADMLDGLAATRPWLRVLRLAANGGVDQDYDLAVGQARGEWCWLFTDDDLPAPGAIARVMTALEAGHDLVVVDAEVRDERCEAILRARQLPFATDRVYRSGDPALLADLGAHLSFIGAVIIRRSLWMERERQKYFGSLFIHVGVIFQKPLPGTALAIAEPLMRIRYGVGGWTSRRARIWLFLWPELIWSFPDYPPQAKLAVCHPQPWRLPYRLFALRAVKAIDGAFYTEMLRSRLSLGQRVLAWVCATMPVAIANRMLTLAHVLLRRPGAGIALFDLRQARQAR